MRLPALCVLAACERTSTTSPPPPPDPVPVTPDASPADPIACDEATLRAAATELGFAPRIYVEEWPSVVPGSETRVELPCAPPIDDDDCERVVQAKATPPPGTTRLGAALHGDFSHYEYTYETAGKLRVGSAADRDEITRRMRELRDAGAKDLVLTSGRRMLKPSTRIVTVTFGRHASRKIRRAELRMPLAVPDTEHARAIAEITDRIDKLASVSLTKLAIEGPELSVHLDCAAR